MTRRQRIVVETDRTVVYPPPFDARLHPAGTVVRVEATRTGRFIEYVSDGFSWRISVEGRS